MTTDFKILSRDGIWFISNKKSFKLNIKFIACFQQDKLGKTPLASHLFECVHRRKKGKWDFPDNKIETDYTFIGSCM